MAGWLALQLKLLICALQFLTRLPTPAVNGFQEAWITRAARYFPLVGQLIGILSGAVLVLAAPIWGPWAGAILALAAGILLTGAFHEDGLADTVDGLGGGQTPERRLEIMKDSRVGTYGVLALVLMLGLKAALIARVPALSGAFALLAAHGAGRAAAVVAMRATPYSPAATAGKWKPTPRGVTTAEAGFACLTALWPLALLPSSAAILGLGGGALLAVITCLVARRLIGGHTGDVLGAVEQMFEIGFLLGAVALLS